MERTRTRPEPPPHPPLSLFSFSLAPVSLLLSLSRRCCCCVCDGLLFFGLSLALNASPRISLLHGGQDSRQLGETAKLFESAAERCFRPTTVVQNTDTSSAGKPAQRRPSLRVAQGVRPLALPVGVHVDVCAVIWNLLRIRLLCCPLPLVASHFCASIAPRMSYVEPVVP